MITVTVLGTEYQCELAVKGQDFIQLYDAEEVIVASWFNIVDFSNFSISGGDWTPYVEEILTVRGAAISDGLITMDGYEWIETGSIIKLRAPANSEETTRGISIDGVALPIVNVMGMTLNGVENVWPSGAALALLVDKVYSKAYLLNVCSTAYQKDLGTITIQTQDWTEEEPDADFPFSATIECRDVLESHNADVIIEKDNLHIAAACGFCPTMETLDGEVKFWSMKTPQKPISCNITITGDGGFGGGSISGGSGAVEGYVLPKAGPNTLGGVMIGDNIYMDEDGRITPTGATLTTEQTATDEDIDAIIENVFGSNSDA